MTWWFWPFSLEMQGHRYFTRTFKMLKEMCTAFCYPSVPSPQPIKGLLCAFVFSILMRRPDKSSLSKGLLIRTLRHLFSGLAFTLTKPDS